MFGQIGFRELNADSKEAGREDDTHDFEGYQVGMLSPIARVEYASKIRPHEDAEGGPDYHFVYIEL